MSLVAPLGPPSCRQPARSPACSLAGQPASLPACQLASSAAHCPRPVWPERARRSAGRVINLPGWQLPALLRPFARLQSRRKVKSDQLAPRRLARAGRLAASQLPPTFPAFSSSKGAPIRASFAPLPAAFGKLSSVGELRVASRHLPVAARAQCAIRAKLSSSSRLELWAKQSASPRDCVPQTMCGPCNERPAHSLRSQTV